MTSQNFRRKHSRNSFDDEYDKPVCISSDGNVTSSSSVSYNSTKSSGLQRHISNHASRRLPTLSINNTTTSTGSSSTTTAAAPQRFNVLPPPAAQLPFSVWIFFLLFFPRSHIDSTLSYRSKNIAWSCPSVKATKRIRLIPYFLWLCLLWSHFFSTEKKM